MVVNVAHPCRIPPKPDLLCTDVDYKGVVYGTQLAIHFMRKNKTPGGKIVATASVAGIVPHESYPGKFDISQIRQRLMEINRVQWRKGCGMYGVSKNQVSYGVSLRHIACPLCVIIDQHVLVSFNRSTGVENSKDRPACRSEVLLTALRWLILSEEQRVC